MRSRRHRPVKALARSGGDGETPRSPWRDDLPAAAAASLLSDVRQVSRRARQLRGRCWAPLLVFGATLLVGVDVIDLRLSPPAAVRCARFLGHAAAASGDCGASAVGRDQAVSVSASQTTHSLTVVQKAPFAMSLGNQWWFWILALLLGMAALAIYRLLATRCQASDLMWYPVALLSAVAGQQATGHAGWPPVSAGMFALGCALAVLAAGDRQPLTLASGGGLLVASAVFHHSPVLVVASSPVPVALQSSAMAQVALGIVLLAVAVVMRWKSRGRPQPLSPGAYRAEVDDA